VGTRLWAGAAWCGLVTLMVVAAGCGGGGGRLSAPGYAREASTICEHANRRVAVIRIPPLTRWKASTNAVRRAARIQDQAASDLRDLRAPGRLADLDSVWVALVDQSAHELHLMARSLRHQELGAATEDGRDATRLTVRAQELVAPAGITSCAGPVFEDL
jgi:hypothetical protein